jgi:MFS family permease
VAAVLQALCFHDPEPQAIGVLNDSEWKAALHFTDRAGLTLILAAICRDHLPGWVRERTDRNLAGNAERLRRLRSDLTIVTERFLADGIDYLLLKGFSQQTQFVPNPAVRASYDLDLYTPDPFLKPALDILRSLGYEHIHGVEHLPTDHLPAMVRKSGWQWRGDYYDPEIPPTVDLHFRFWDPATECFDAPGVETFWSRRLDEDGITVLDTVDRIGYAALHLLRHLLRGSVRASHVFEIAYFLETQCNNEELWNKWRSLHSAPLRRLEVISFRLAAEWFQCRLSPAVQEGLGTIDADVVLWFKHYSTAPLETLFRPNKNELWLHFTLVESSRDRRRVFLRRVLPTSLPGPVDAVFTPDRQITWRLRWRSRARYAKHLLERAAHHIRTLPGVIKHGATWKFRTSGLTRAFWRFLLTASLYNLPVSIFFLLYNLYLLDRGFKEDTLGVIAGAFTAGSVAGVLPSAAFVHRLGLKPTLVVCFAGTAIACAMRTILLGIPALLASAFTGGALLSIWAVCISPVVASLTSERARPVGFSVIFGSGIGLGVLAGLVGGRLPGWFLSAGMATSQAGAKQIALLAAGAFSLLALWPLAKLRLEAPRARETRSYPMNPFIARFLLAIALWSFATGAFNPFFNAYFARQFRLPVETIGLVFSMSQALQVAAVLLAPIVLRKLGLVRGVAAMQAATAVMLAAVAVSPAPVMAAVLYAGYSSFQYMSEPGIYTLLMNRVPPEQHSGASALNFLAVFGAQALAASVAGAVVSRFGYAAMLSGASAMAACAGLAFWWLLEKPRVVSEPVRES